MLACAFLILFRTHTNVNRIAVATSASADSVVCISREGQVERWSIEAGYAKEPPTIVNVGVAVTSASLLPETSTCLAVSDDGSVSLFDTETGKLIKTVATRSKDLPDRWKSLSPLVLTRLDRTGYWLVKQVKSPNGKRNPGCGGELYRIDGKTGDAELVIYADSLLRPQGMAERPGVLEFYAPDCAGGLLTKDPKSDNWAGYSMEGRGPGAFVDGGRSLAYLLKMMPSYFGFVRRVNGYASGTGVPLPTEGIDRIYAPPQRAVFLFASSKFEMIVGMRSSTVDVAWTMRGVTGGTVDMSFAKKSRVGAVLCGSGKVLLFDYGTGETLTTIAPG